MRNMEKTTIESQVASAVLERKVGSIVIDGKTYEIAPPTLATLILISELVSTLPVVERVPNNQIVNSVLHYAKDYRKLGDICAVLILGAKNLTQEIEETHTRRILGLFKRSYTTKRTIDRKTELSRLITENMRPSVVFDVIVKRLQDMEVGSFFSITTSLSEANILKPTKEVER
nr:MAG TPA: hypothetical protein [Caudoviricetes sp.]